MVSAVITLSFLISAPGKPLPVAYVLREERTSWQPVEPADVENTLGHAALEILSKGGVLSLDKTTELELRKKPRDYVLRITGRMLDEAETHTVFLSLDPGAGAEIGSLRASDTVAIARLKQSEMLTKIEESARRAATDLGASLQKAMERSKGSVAGAPPPPLDTGPLPWRWADVSVTVPASLRADDDLEAKDAGKRQASLRELTSLALSQAAPRHALERCALKHALPDMRLGCLVALRPLARKNDATRRVVTEVFRKDASSDVAKEATEQMMYFTGGARMEAIEAWLERAAKGEAWGPFSQLGDLPNIDTVVARCLIAAGKREKYQRSKRACIEMMPPIPQPRRKAILWRFLQELDPESPFYIEGAGDREGSMGTDWQWAVEQLLNGAKRFEPGLEDILWKRYERTLSSNSIDVLSGYAAPSEKMTARFLELIQTAGQRGAVWALQRFVKEDPKLGPMIKDKVAEMLATESFHKNVSKRDLEDLMKKAGGGK